MISEYLLGRRGASNPFRSFRNLAPGSRWYWIGFVAVLASGCILSFYCVVGGWSLKYLANAVTGSLMSYGADYGDYFQAFISNPWKPLLYTMMFLGLTGIQSAQMFADILTSLTSLPFVVKFMRNTPAEDLPSEIDKLYGEV